jgi:glycosyltransferase involved in cell wall biosynthesis
MEHIVEFDLGGSFLRRKAQIARWQLMRQLRTDGVAIAQSFDFYSNLMLIPVARWAGVPVIVASNRNLGDSLTPAQSCVQQIAFSLCNRVVCNSRASANRLIGRGVPESKVVVIPNGLSVQAFANAVPAIPRDRNRFRVGFVARMNDAVKNHEGFLRAAARVVSMLPNVEFVLAGDGHLRPALETLARRLGLAENTRFLGERSDIPEVMAALDVMVLFSLSESLPNVVLEAMAAGVPVVASRVGGVPELVRHEETGLLITPGDEDELAAAIVHLLTQPSVRVHYGKRAREVAKANFDVEYVTQQYQELYLQLLAEKLGSKQQIADYVPARQPTARPLRVAIVAPSNKEPGGQSVQAELLLRHWQHDPAVSAHFVPIDPSMPRWLAWVERVPYLRTIARTPFYLWSLWRGTTDVDAIHIFSASYWSFLLAPAPAWLAGRLRRKGTVINYRSGEARDHLRRSYVARSILKMADRVVVPSEYLRGEFRQFGIKTYVVSNFTDDDQFHYRLRQPLRALLICPRGFHPYYRVDLVVRAFAQIQTQYPAARLCLLGSGPQRGMIQQLTVDLAAKNIEFAGSISRKDIGRYYDRNDIFVNASCLDNMPGSILEAFASGTPVVTTAPEGIRYIVEHERTGLLCEPGDWNALADNVCRLLKEPLLAYRLARNAFEESQRYNWKTVRGLWLDIYRSMSPQQFSCTKAQPSCFSGVDPCTTLLQ